MNFLITLLLKATLCLALTSLLYLSVGKASASLRHWIISLSLIGLLVLPFSSTVLPEWEVETKVAQLLPSINETAIPNHAIPLATSAEDQAKEFSAKISHPVDPKPSLALQMISVDAPIASSRLGILAIVCAIWALGSLFFFGRLLWGIRSTVKLSQTASPVGRDLPQGISSRTKVAYHSAIKSPMTWGIIRPQILLPVQAKHWSKETLEVVLLHEMTHIKRQDYLIHILSWITVSLYWFHPLVWWFKKLQSEEREKACDEQVLKAGLAKTTYAEQLVQVAKYLSHKNANVPYSDGTAESNQESNSIYFRIQCRSILFLEMEAISLGCHLCPGDPSTGLLHTRGTDPIDGNG